MCWIEAGLGRVRFPTELPTHSFLQGYIAGREDEIVPLGVTFTKLVFPFKILSRDQEELTNKLEI